jgi:hypothetical protein
MKTFRLHFLLLIVNFSLATVLPIQWQARDQGIKADPSNALDVALST